MTSERELLEMQVRVLKVLLDGMECYLYWDPIEESIILSSKHDPDNKIPITPPE